jgi:hypothetical protein
MSAGPTHPPFALRLSKGFSSEEEWGFDKLSPNGFWAY